MQCCFNHYGLVMPSLLMPKHRNCSTSARVVACCLVAQSHYLNRCYVLYILCIYWHNFDIWSIWPIMIHFIKNPCWGKNNQHTVILKSDEMAISPTTNIKITFFRVHLIWWMITYGTCKISNLLHEWLLWTIDTYWTIAEWNFPHHQ